MLSTSNLVLDRLYLRNLGASDVSPRYLSWMQDGELLRYMEARFQVHTSESLRSYIETVNQSSCELLLGIFLNDSKEHIGNIKLGPISAQHRQAALGLLIGHREHWGRGYASEAIRGVTNHAFQSLGLNKLYAGCYASNEGSRKAFVKAGFHEEGRFRGHWLLDGKPEDGLQLGFHKSDWTGPLG